MSRSLWGLMWLEQAVNDVRYATRWLARTLLFPAIVIGTLAVGIGVPRQFSVCLTASCFARFAS